MSISTTTNTHQNAHVNVVRLDVVGVLGVDVRVVLGLGLAHLQDGLGKGIHPLDAWVQVSPVQTCDGENV